MSTTTQQIGPWVVLNCSITQILGHYPDEQSAAAAAAEFGNCSFPYELSETEIAGMREIAAAEAAE